MKYISKYVRNFGKTRKELSSELNISPTTLQSWYEKGFDIYEKHKELNYFRGNKILQTCWRNINQRCCNKKDKKYKNYGGKSIKVKISKEELFAIWNRDRAYYMKQPSVDRIDSKGNYEFCNCRFIEMKLNRMRRFSKDS